MGTIIKDAETGEILADLSEKIKWRKYFQEEEVEKEIHILQHQQDKHLVFLKEEKKGLKKEVILELKLLADVGLIGFPNVGKSTFLSVVTSATPKNCRLSFYNTRTKFRCSKIRIWR